MDWHVSWLSSFKLSYISSIPSITKLRLVTEYKTKPIVVVLLEEASGKLVCVSELDARMGVRTVVWTVDRTRLQGGVCDGGPRGCPGSLGTPRGVLRRGPKLVREASEKGPREIREGVRQ